LIEIFDCEQNSEAWLRARLGLPTASMFATIMAKGKGGGESLTRKTYLYKLAGEIITGEPTENYTNGYMERGHALEGEARDMYSFMVDVEPQRVGFIKNGDKGCSPDSLIGSDGALEIKTKAPHLLIETLFREDGIPPEHVAQVQGVMWVAERDWLDFVAYFPRMPLFKRRVRRDNGYIANLAGEVARFNDELAAIVERLRNYGVAA
jgi:hypothetical protein